MPDYPSAGAEMVERQIRRLGVKDERVLAAMLDVPREAFVENGFEGLAYEDSPLPIGEGQTISQPYIVAVMVEAAELSRGARILEIGGGSGYAAAVISRIAGEACVVERCRVLALKAKERWARLDFANIEILEGDGTRGWPEKAPFDAILVSAGARGVSPALQDQLFVGGKLIIPVGGSGEQRLPG